MKSLFFVALLALVGGVCAQNAISTAPIATITPIPTLVAAPLPQITLTAPTLPQVTLIPPPATTPALPAFDPNAPVVEACAIVEKASTVISKLKSQVLLPKPGQACGNHGVCTSKREWCHGVIVGGCQGFCCQPTNAHATTPSKAALPQTGATSTSASTAASTTPAASTAGKTPLGPSWVNQFPGSASLDDLNPTFGPKAKAFIAAIRATGATVSISATHRPIERSYMMYNAWRIAKGMIAANKVPAYPGVNIDWTAGGNLVQAKSLAKSMCAAFGVNWASARQKVAAQGLSRHNFKAAVDMNIQGYVGKSIADPSGKLVKVTGFSGLVALGSKYGVHYFSGENMHWSDTGH